MDSKEGRRLASGNQVIDYEKSQQRCFAQNNQISRVPGRGQIFQVDLWIAFSCRWVERGGSLIKRTYWSCRGSEARPQHPIGRLRAISNFSSGGFLHFWHVPLLICIDPPSIISLSKNNLEKFFHATNEKWTYKGGSILSEQIVPILVLGISFYNHRCFPSPNQDTWEASD